MDSIKIITQTAQNYADVLAKHKLANNFIDIFLKLINDPNAKVSQQALTSFNMIIEDIQVKKLILILKGFFFFL